jgi:hypothetical protein
LARAFGRGHNRSRKKLINSGRYLAFDFTRSYVGYWGALHRRKGELCRKVAEIGMNLRMLKWKLAQFAFWLNRFRTLPRAMVLFQDVVPGIILNRSLFGYRFFCDVSRDGPQGLLFSESRSNDIAPNRGCPECPWYSHGPRRPLARIIGQERAGAHGRQGSHWRTHM